MSVEEFADSVYVLFCGGNPNLAELDKYRPIIVKQSRIHKMLRWLINESNFDGDCTARSTQFRLGRVRSTRPIQLLRRFQLQPLRLRLPSGLLPKYLFEHVHVLPPPTDEPIHSWLLFEKVLLYLNQDKPTYVIPTGDAPLWEPSDELVLSKLWPHLDPFGLVGFCIERNLKASLDEQVNHLLNLYDSDFDATQVFRQLAFRVPKEKVARIATAQLEIDLDVLAEMIKKSKDTKRYKATTEAEKHINRILAELQNVGDKIQGTTAQMLDMRNEIRGNVNVCSMYTLFVTVNLADLHSPDKFLDQADTV
ncbi:BQ5605_C014g07535 [Microbotryum silenes-dioicae]|uniref:BQ5605_C014g07535 protein n=1 Tax=Microbotryum silenes-dioicae TaxID=796604 RepID=A0A2X0LTT7_9BASI|nr:BQ5605_C014g07535 [Microbotryum silenes-dioicae]